MLLDEHSMIASPECSSPYPNGNLLFDENHVDPPSTAYLKLWEALSRTHARPGPASVCLDAGSSPGGWTWVLQSLGARVVSVDRSELDDRLMKNPLVEFHAGNAFLCTPKTIETYGVGRLDWLVCDLAAYPRRLLAWLREWLESGLADNYVVTLKMQGEPDWDAIREFASIPGSTTYHGSFNKHELTWILENANGEQSLGTQSLA